ncbi:MAG TPA: hypothetical protein GX514_09125 [Thermoanaerobacterales bacterium]|nr:hypothetical protein [Thermoanaerobacterales bacterium]
MGKVYDISSKLTSEKPKIKIAENKEFVVNNSMKNMLKIDQMLQNADIDNAEFLNQAITLFLGEEAAKVLDEMDLSVKNYQTIFMAIMAAVQEIDIEEAEKMFQESKSV